MKVIDFVDDEIHALMKKVQKKFNLSWEKARDEVNKAIKTLIYDKKCYICSLKEEEKCDKCKKGVCKYHLLKGYANKKSKKVLEKICQKCFDKRRISVKKVG